MKKRRAYRAIAVKDVVLSDVLREAPVGPVTVGVDNGKYEVFVVVRFRDGSFLRPWKVDNPLEIGVLVGVLQDLAAVRPLVVAMESTGTYGDALRGKLGEGGLEVHRVGAKAAHDYAEIFDGVPSQHDGKDAAVIAELAAIGKSYPWPYCEPSTEDADMAYWVDWLDAQQDIQRLWTGRLEALLARYWPELTRLLGLTSVALLRMLRHYGGPAGVAADPASAQQLVRWGRVLLKPKKIEEVIASAERTVGLRQGRREQERMRQYAAACLAAYRETQVARRELKRLAKCNEVVRRQSNVVGAATACVLWVALGDPRDYPSGEAYRKAMGLNLKERSSGEYQGRLKITKRGPSIVRRWLYLAALRQIQDSPVRCWYEAKKAKDQGRGKGALIAVMRKLALALHAVGANGKRFEPWRLFPGRWLARQAQQAQRKQKAAFRGKAMACRSREDSGRDDFPVGGSAPKPPGFIAARPIPKAKERRAECSARPSVLASEAALGSVPTVALSSAPIERV
jgi:transposase